MFSTTIAELRVGISIALLCPIVGFPGSVIASEEVILVVGDSLSAGYGLDIRRSWTALLQQRLHALGLSHKVVNASISGDTTSGGLARLPGLLSRHRPMIVVIELDADDGLRGIPIAEAERNLHRMLDLVTATDASALLLEMRVPPNYGPSYAQQFEELFSRRDEMDGVKLVPFFMHDVVLSRSMMQSDGLHPNANAQPKMLENVWVYLRDTLNQ